MANISLKELKFNESENPRGKILSTVDKKLKLNHLEKKNIRILLEKRKKETNSLRKKNILENIIKSLDLSLNHEINDSRENNFRLNLQETNWLKRFTSEDWVDYLIYRYNLRMIPKNQILTKFPPYVLIEPTSICNLRCIMCFQVDSSFTKKEFMGMMPWNIFKKTVDEVALNNCKAVTLASRGEPTLHPKLPEMIEYISQKGILDLKINTNATKLNEKISRSILKNNVSELVFSLDAGNKETYEKVRVKGRFDQVLQNIINFNKLRNEEYKQSKCITRISGVKVLEEQDIDQMTSFWKEHVDEVAIKPATPRWDSYNNEKYYKKEPCTQLWERIYVWYDGKLNPCDFDYKSFLSVGNIENSSIKEVWNSEAYNLLRKKHLDKKRDNCYPCDRCPL